MSGTQEKTLSVDIYTKTRMEFEGTENDLKDVFPDVYAEKSQGGDKEDLGVDEHHYSINGKSEMVLVDKGLLLALIDESQRHTENDAIYDDTRNTSYKWKDINKLVMGVSFPDSVTTVS